MTLATATAQEAIRDALRHYGLTPEAAPWIEGQLAERGQVIVSAARAAELLDALREAEPRVAMLHQWLRATPNMGVTERNVAAELARIRAALAAPPPILPSPTAPENPA